MALNPNNQSRDVFVLKGPAQAQYLQSEILAGMDEPPEPLDTPKTPKPAQNSPPFPVPLPKLKL